MSVPSFAEGAVSLGSRIGRYFSVVSVLPALILVLWSAALAASGAWTGPPNLSRLTGRLGEITPAGIGWVLLATFTVGLLLHPLQFQMTQLLEGYWGHQPFGRALAQLRVRHYRTRRLTVRRTYDALSTQLETEIDALLLAEDGVDPNTWPPEYRERRRRGVLNSPDGAHLTALQAAVDAYDHEMRGFPDPSRILPTRLGNALRREEDRIGRQYGLHAILTAPHFSLVAPERHVAYVDDARYQLDLAIRLCVVFLLAVAEGFACLLTDGWWLLLCLVPHSLAYIAYRAAVAAADEYTAAVRTVVDLNRFGLYESLNVEPPPDADAERTNNKALMQLLYGEHADIRFRKPPEAPPATPPGNP